MKKLFDILYKVPITATSGRTNMWIFLDVQIDSRKDRARQFVYCRKRFWVDGHLFIDKAIERELWLLFAKYCLLHKQDADVTFIQTNNSAEAAGIISHNFYGQPSENLKLVGVTGTNGKTTIATLLYKLFTCLGYNCGLLSTVENSISRQNNSFYSYNTRCC